MILVVSASTHPEPQHMAAALARNGQDVRFATALSFASDQWPMRLARALPANPVTSELLRRELPHGLTGELVDRSAHGHEAMSVWHRRVRRDVTKAKAAIARRNQVVRNHVVDQVRALKPEILIVQAENDTAVDLFAAAPASCLRILNYPIAHHRWIAREFERERLDNPQWAFALPPADMSEAKMRSLDAEIEAADAVIVYSTLVKRSFEEFGVTSKPISIVPLAAPTTPDLGKSPDLFSPQASFRILFAGQVHQRKGISYLVDAFQQLDLPGAELAFVGPVSPQVQEHLSSFPQVVVHGPVPRAQLMAAEAEADVVVLPSLAEGFPLTAIEAMSVGTPIIVSTATFGHDVITDGVDGYVVPTRDVPALRDALRLLATDPAARERMGRAAAVRAGDFTWETFETRFLSALAELQDQVAR